MTGLKQITIGGISDAWLIAHADKNSNEITLTADYVCKIKIIKITDGTVIVERDITQKQDNSFLVYMPKAETLILEEGVRYKLVAQLENPVLPKPLDKEVSTEFEAVKGYID